jgi:hypothetical protein
MPKKDTIQYRLYMKNYMSKKRMDSHKPVIDDYVISFYQQLEHFKRYRKVLRDLVKQCDLFSLVKKYDNVMEELEILYPTYNNFRIGTKLLAYSHHH